MHAVAGLAVALWVALLAASTASSVSAGELEGQVFTGEQLSPDQITVVDGLNVQTGALPAGDASGVTPVSVDSADDAAVAPGSEAVRQGLGTTPTIRRNFAGAMRGDAGQLGFPADASGAIGPFHFVEVTNGQFQVYDRLSGQRLVNSSLAAFFSPLPTRGNPRVLYDQHSGRWIVLACNFDTDARIQIAVSRSGDPTSLSGWFKFSFVAAGGDEPGCWPDYPTLGVDAAGIYTAAYMTNCDAMTIFAIDKAPLLAAQPSAPTITAFRGTTVGIGFEGAIQPVHTYGTAAGEYLISRGTATTLRLRRVSGPLTSPTLANLPSIIVPQYAPPPNAPALESSPNIFTLDQRMMNAVYRNGSIWTVHTVNVGGLGACRWYQVNATNSTLVQSGTVNNGARHYYYPSIAVNAREDVAIGFSTSSATEYIGAGLAGRKFSDAVGEMCIPVLYAAGVGAINLFDTLGRNRWGDYSMTSLDPVLEVEFWTVQSFGSIGNAWATKIASFDYGDCDNNGIDDACDVDCDAPGCGSANCGTASDCDGNGRPDACDTLWNDCNTNQIHDACDVQPGGASADCNSNGVPDECEPAANDCNHNLIPDTCEAIALGAALLQPTGVTDCAGAPVEFVTGGPVGATYRWYRNGVPLSDGDRINGSMGSTLVLDPAMPQDSGAYFCRVTQGCISADTGAAGLTVIASELQITQEPVAQVTVCAATGQGAILEFHVDQAAEVSYHWSKDGAPLADGARVSGALTSQLRIASAVPTDSGTYTCHASTPCGGAADSDPARGKLVVVGTVFESMPQPICAPVGGAAAFRARVNSSAGTAYFWYRDGNLLDNGTDSNGMVVAGANTPHLELQNVPAMYDGASFVLLGFISSPTCSSLSVPAILTVGNCGDCNYPGDLDGDLDLDLADLARFTACFGSEISPESPCRCADVAGMDNTLDLLDWAALQPALSGPG